MRIDKGKNGAEIYIGTTHTSPAKEVTLLNMLRCFNKFLDPPRKTNFLGKFKFFLIKIYSWTYSPSMVKQSFKLFSNFSIPCLKSSSFLIQSELLWQRSPCLQTWIYFSRASFWDLPSAYNSWGSNLSNMPVAGAIRSVAHSNWPLLPLICDTVHCLRC